MQYYNKSLDDPYSRSTKQQDTLFPPGKRKVNGGLHAVIISCSPYCQSTPYHGELHPGGPTTMKCMCYFVILSEAFLRRLITKPLLKSLGGAGIKVFLKSSSIFRRKRPSRAKEVRSMGSNTIFCLIFCRLSLSLSYCIQEMFFSSILSYQFWWLTDNCPFSQGKLVRNCRVTKIPLCCCGYCYSYFFCNQEQGFRTMSRCV